MSSLICWCYVFLGRPRLLVAGIASSITLRVTLFASRLWTCPNQRRRPPRITSSDFLVSHVILSRHSEDPAQHPHLCGSNLPLVGHLQCPAFAPISQGRSDNGLLYLRFEPEGNLPVIQYSGHFSPYCPYSLHAKVHVSVDGAIFIYHRSQVLGMVNIPQFFSIQIHWQRLFPVDRCSVFATLIFRQLYVNLLL